MAQPLAGSPRSSSVRWRTDRAGAANRHVFRVSGLAGGGLAPNRRNIRPDLIGKTVV
jgi:hypothetical protein